MDNKDISTSEGDKVMNSLLGEIAATLHTADKHGVLDESCFEFVNPLVELFEHLLAQEREEVREMCLEAITDSIVEITRLKDLDLHFHKPGMYLFFSVMNLSRY